MALSTTLGGILNCEITNTEHKSAKYLEALVPSRDSRTKTRSPSPRAWPLPRSRGAAHLHQWLSVNPRPHARFQERLSDLAAVTTEATDYEDEQ